MSMSGVIVDDDVVNLYNELKGSSGKAFEGRKRYPNQKLKTVGFKFSKNLERIEVDEELTSFPTPAESTSTVDYDVERADWQKFCDVLPKDQCRYAVYDLYYNMKSGLRNKVVMIAWAPDTATIKDKMLFASTKDTVKKKLQGIADECQATDYDELDLAQVIDKVSRGQGVYDR